MSFLLSEGSDFKFSVSASGVVTVVFRDGFSFSFSTQISPSNIGVSPWHLHGVSGKLPTIKTYGGLPVGFPPAGLLPVPQIPYAKLKFEFEDCWMGLRDYPEIEYLDLDVTFDSEFGNPVQNDDITQVDLWGPVDHIIDSRKAVLVNATLPAHGLHEGYVVRHVIGEADGTISIDSVGFGIGPHADVNDLGAPLVWARASLKTISRFAAQYYFIRTGNPGTIYPFQDGFLDISNVYPSDYSSPVY